MREKIKSAGQNSAKTVCVAVAAHKPYKMPADPMYMPMHVGKALHPDVDLGDDFTPDNTGNNISDLNAYYSELTAIYWLWKNCDADYKGLVHYRRHFATRNVWKRLTARDRFARIARSQDVLPILAGDDSHKAVDIIVPKKRHYYIETIYSHYSHTFDAHHFDETRNILQEMHPEAVPAFDRLMQSRSAHIFNMFIMSRERFDEYCAWMFPIIEELTRRIPPESYDAFGARYPGRVSERLLDVWLETTKYRYAELPVTSPEPVNWWKKGTGFLKAKFVGKKYNKSF
ncbi:glycosyl transferase [Bifidobacterium goeldii]|uniref:Glycosyl transferase n=1 Tax=Bifidobacterium goeldii TaxID=2306975 RepID=A0A430FFV1_9BIFI|nr:DUF4422 domain-containing protein [Bifidobacterium goeldii]RSX51764.1 glycosyl transferase [Bifidobacterium goeldii]